MGFSLADVCRMTEIGHDAEKLAPYFEIARLVRDEAHIVRLLTERLPDRASCTFRGPYEKIGEVYAAIAAWIADNGYECDGPMFNIYHVSPHETQNPDEFVTEVCFPVREA